MAADETTFIFLAVYDDEDDAQADYDVVKELYAANAIGNFDAAVIRRDPDGKIHVTCEYCSRAYELAPEGV